MPDADRYLRTSLLPVRYWGGYVLVHPGSSVTLLTDPLGAQTAMRLIRGQSEAEVCMWAESCLPGAGKRATRLIDRLDMLGAITSHPPRLDLRWRLRGSFCLLAGHLLAAASVVVPHLPVLLLRALLDALPHTPMVARTLGQIQPYVDTNLQASGYAHASARWRQGIARACASASARTFFLMYLALVLPPRKALELAKACFDLESFTTLERLLRETDGAVLAGLHTSLYVGLAPLLHDAGWETAAIADISSLGIAVGGDRLAGLATYNQYSAVIIDSGSLMGGRELLKQVRLGKLAVVAFDTPPRAATDLTRTPSIPFLGRRLCRFDGPAWLSVRSGQPIIFVATYQRGHRTAIYTRPPLSPAPGLPPQAQVMDLTARLYGEGEAFLRCHPDAWMAWSYAHDLVAPVEDDVEQGECRKGIEPIPTR